jgi:hypothetical protein
MVSTSQVFASIEAALLFILVSHPAVYRLTQRVLGGIATVTTRSGVVTPAGLLIHAVVFGVLVYLLMVIQGRRDGFVDGQYASVGHDDQSEADIEEFGDFGFGSFFKNIGNKISGFGKKTGNKIAGAGKTAGKKIAGAGKTTGHKLSSVGKKAGGKITYAGKKVGHTFSHFVDGEEEYEEEQEEGEEEQDQGIPHRRHREDFGMVPAYPNGNERPIM